MARSESDTQICYAEYFAGHVRIKAWLLAKSEGLKLWHKIILEQEDEQACCDLDMDTRAARELFLRLVWGGVSACTLADIVEDYSGTHF